MKFMVIVIFFCDTYFSNMSVISFNNWITQLYRSHLLCSWPPSQPPQHQHRLPMVTTKTMDMLPRYVFFLYYLATNSIVIAIPFVYCNLLHCIDGLLPSDLDMFRRVRQIASDMRLGLREIFLFGDHLIGKSNVFKIAYMDQDQMNSINILTGFCLWDNHSQFYVSIVKYVKSAPVVHYASAPVIHSAPVVHAVKHVAPATSYATFSQVHVSHPAPVVKYTSAPIVKYASAPIIKYAPAPIVKYESAPIVKYESAPIVKYSAPAVHYVSQPVVKVNKTIYIFIFIDWK